jgi:aerobactin synthase
MSPWDVVNLNLLSKTLGELSYEGILSPKKIEGDDYVLELKSGAIYFFKAWRGIWDHLRVNPMTIKKKDQASITAGQFFLDAQAELEMDDIILSNFLEEMHNSLYSDLRVYEKQKNVSALQMTDFSGEKVQAFLNGHPKILLSKGRVGWGSPELEKFAPESERPIRLHWIAVKKNILSAAFDDSMDMNALLAESMDDKEILRFKKQAEISGATPEEFYFLPVHPWQWERFIQTQFVEFISLRQIVSIGIFGDEYLPQISIRTLSNISRPKKVDIKLPLSILNTSAIRGIPARYISIGTKLSRHILGLCHEDELLKEKNTDILIEKAGMSFEHPLFSQVSQAPYRYKEYLGVVWRESSQSKIDGPELAILTGSLFYQDHSGASLVGAYIKKSGLTKNEWLKKYFEVVVIPLYHLQLKYGLGLVAHGQNIVLKLKNFAPSGIILKDFQGDLRLSDKSILIEREDFKHIASKLDKLPAHYLIHDLLTGHLVTVLRFISEVMEESDGIKEIEFYKILAQVVSDYLKGQEVPSELNFLNATINRVLVNKVRFKVGYADSSERPKPMVGLDLANPLYLGLKHE